MKSLTFVALVAVAAAAPAQVKTKPAAPAAPAELKWMNGPPSLPGGVEMAVVKGDPGKKGPFTIHLKMPANYSVPPHWHPTDESVTLVSGKLAYGMSDRLDRLNAKALAAGDTVVMKAKEHHWVVTADGAEVEVSALGPFQITYVDPSADPRHKAEPKPKP